MGGVSPKYFVEEKKSFLQNNYRGESIKVRIDIFLKDSLFSQEFTKTRNDIEEKIDDLTKEIYNLKK